MLQQDFDTRPSGGLKTQVRQVGKPTPGGKPAPVVTDEAAPPARLKEKRRRRLNHSQRRQMPRRRQRSLSRRSLTSDLPRLRRLQSSQPPRLRRRSLHPRRRGRGERALALEHGEGHFVAVDVLFLGVR